MHYTHNNNQQAYKFVGHKDNCLAKLSMEDATHRSDSVTNKGPKEVKYNKHLLKMYSDDLMNQMRLLI